jgi:hypothetical protein
LMRWPGPTPLQMAVIGVALKSLGCFCDHEIVGSRRRKREMSLIACFASRLL